MKIGSLKVAFTYAGCIIGAGFLSGQELWQFFGSYGSLGVLGFVLAIVLQAVLGTIVINFAKSTKTYEFDKLIVRKDNKILKGFFIFCEVIFIFSVVVIMFAGAGSLIESSFNFPSFWGSIIFALVITVVAFLGINGITKILSLTIPLLTVVTVVISIMSLYRFGYPIFTNLEVTGKTPLMPNFFVAFILFSVHNLFCSLGVLAPLGGLVKDDGTAFKGMTVCSIVLVIISFAVLLPIYSSPNYADSDLPMLEISKAISAPLFYVYSALLLIGMFGSALSHLVSLTDFIYRKNKYLEKRKFLVLIPISLIALVFSRLGFSNLISVMYPISGYIGIVAFIMIVVNYIINKKEKITK